MSQNARISRNNDRVNKMIIVEMTFDNRLTKFLIKKKC